MCLTGGKSRQRVQTLRKRLPPPGAARWRIELFSQDCQAGSCPPEACQTKFCPSESPGYGNAARWGSERTDRRTRDGTGQGDTGRAAAAPGLMSHLHSTEAHVPPTQHWGSCPTSRLPPAPFQAPEQAQSSCSV